LPLEFVRRSHKGAIAVFVPSKRMTNGPKLHLKFRVIRANRCRRLICCSRFRGFAAIEEESAGPQVRAVGLGVHTAGTAHISQIDQHACLGRVHLECLVERVDRLAAESLPDAAPSQVTKYFEGFGLLIGKLQKIAQSFLYSQV
jgi:hypothetical protein